MKDQAKFTFFSKLVHLSVFNEASERKMPNQLTLKTSAERYFQKSQVICIVSSIYSRRASPDFSAVEALTHCLISHFPFIKPSFIYPSFICSQTSRERETERCKGKGQKKKPHKCEGASRGRVGHPVTGGLAV